MILSSYQHESERKQDYHYGYFAKSINPSLRSMSFLFFKVSIFNVAPTDFTSLHTSSIAKSSIKR